MPITLSASASVSVRRGHPWVFRQALTRPPGDLASGDSVALVDARGEPLGAGLWDATSPLAVRVHEAAPATRIDQESLIRRISAALALRDTLFEGDDTTAYRLCNGEGDRVPGLVLDRYEHVCVMRLDGASLGPWAPRLAEPLFRLLSARGMRSLALRFEPEGSSASKLRTLVGKEPPDRVVVRERGMAMDVDLARGQKTGAFLDQRDNRARVRSMAAGKKRVLNLYSYAGGFSVAAALGGAAHVTSVDIAAGAHASAQQSFRENGVDPAKHAFVTADVFSFLEQDAKRGHFYDLIVSDPPSFAPNERSKPRGLSAYRRLHAAAARVLEEGGTLCAGSCSSHVTLEDFVATLDDASLGRSDLRLCDLFGQPPDHPTLPAWPEGRYLKFAVLV